MVVSIITPAEKDKVLNYLCISCLPEQFSGADMKPILETLEISFDTFYAIMNQFQRIGFISELGLNRRSMNLILLTEAHDFALRGGFIVQEELLENNIHKLLLEIDNLKKELGPKHLETINKLSSIASAIFSGLTLFNK